RNPAAAARSVGRVGTTTRWQVGPPCVCVQPARRSARPAGGVDGKPAGRRRFQRIRPLKGGRLARSARAGGGRPPSGRRRSGARPAGRRSGLVGLGLYGGDGRVALGPGRIVRSRLDLGGGARAPRKPRPPRSGRPPRTAARLAPAPPHLAGTGRRGRRGGEGPGPAGLGPPRRPRGGGGGG